MAHEHFTPGYKTEWSMQMQDFLRFQNSLIEADEIQKSVLSYTDYSMGMIDRYYSVLWNIWANFSTHTKIKDNKEIKTWFLTEFKTVEEQRNKRRRLIQNGRGMMSIPSNLVWALANIHYKLLDVKQMTGLGLMLEVKKKQIDKLKEALGV